MRGVVRLDDGGSLVDLAVRRVRDHIRDQDLKVGDTLPGEGQFARELGVSRAVMREAFGALAALRLIDVANGRRARVGAIDGSVMGTSLDHAVATAQVTVAEVWDVRRTLEVRTADLAARHRSDTDAAEIRAAARAMRTAADIAAVTRSDIAFHQAIARASQNKLFVQIVRSFEPLMTIAVPLAWHTRETDAAREEVLSRHGLIAEAIADRDGARAAALMHAHFDVSIGSVL
ncbi:DNA-binding FadR family transcriptional regulator [Sphingomonas endophytica]|uniref:DNA-binding FadR family transcriptional regulator n=1 Tax=Sphingomonas endophytica TaxID=869719 RepID=A0A7X0JEH4_9SPHN|nr:FCD domain-containing protein [Sphingomonas endophytica]MBB6505734.1 DNA-binding FadR family transcriptional regulator [Sphingomonas endophytica]